MRDAAFAGKEQHTAAALYVFPQGCNFAAGQGAHAHQDHGIVHPEPLHDQITLFNGFELERHPAPRERRRQGQLQEIGTLVFTLYEQQLSFFRNMQRKMTHVIAAKPVIFNLHHAGKPAPALGCCRK